MGIRIAARSACVKIAVALLVFRFAIPAVTAWAANPDSPPVQTRQLAEIPAIVTAEMAAGRIPGAVILIGSQGRIVYRRAFGNRMTWPEARPMTTNTIFDLASMTKAVATTTAILQLAEQGKLSLDAPAAGYWPAFAANGKDGITIRQLLTHMSGLRADLDMSQAWSGEKAGLDRIVMEKPRFPPGSHYLYSDINFAVLGELVWLVSGLPLDIYCRRHVFDPLGMKDTAFNPPARWRNRIAPTERIDGQLRWGQPHDPSAFRMGGVAGHAGLFSTAGDLAVFAQMLLDQGKHHKRKILNPASVEEMTVPQTAAGQPGLRGLGWDLGPPLAANRDALPPVGSFGHTGYTGTMMWIDPLSQTYVIVLTSRVHPDGRGDARPLRKQILALVGDALGPLSPEAIASGRPALAPYFGALKGRLQTGLDVLEAQHFAPLKGLRLGVITNQTGIDRYGRGIVDVLGHADGVVLSALLTPEHGLHGDLDSAVKSGIDPQTRLPVYSLYGRDKRPTDEMLRNVDALVYDIQDVGVRFYTYITTMAYAMEAAAKKGIPFYVLDRPDPINASIVQGPVMDEAQKSFTGYFPLPTRYGMTIGELARMFNAENQIGADLHVIDMPGYRRTDWHDQTGLPWIAPSPNLRTLDEAILYPGVAMAEGANVSVGRGTTTPFELLGAPWIDGAALADYLTARQIPGVSFEQAAFTPDDSNFAHLSCQGVRIRLTDRQTLDIGRLGVELISALQRLYPGNFKIEATTSLLGSTRVVQAIRDGQDPVRIVTDWQAQLDAFMGQRAQYLAY